MITNTSELRVRYIETDQMQVAHHACYFAWFEYGRTELMRQIGYPYRKMEEEGVMLPVIEIGGRYYKPARYDDRLHIITEMPSLPRATIRLNYRVVRLPAEELLAEGFTVHVFLSQFGKPIRPTKRFMQVLKPYFN